MPFRGRNGREGALEEDKNAPRTGKSRSRGEAMASEGRNVGDRLLPHFRRGPLKVEDFRRAKLPEGAPELIIGHQIAALPVGEIARGGPITESEDAWRAAVELQRSRRLGLVMHGRMLVEDGVLP